MNTRDKAKQASLNNTEARIEKIIARSEKQSNIVLPTTFEGVDADTGRDKFKTPDQCGGNAVALGKVITTGQLRVGEVVLARTTEGDRRLDKRTSFSRSSDCGDGGAPGQRGYARIVQSNNEAEELVENPESEFEDSDTPPDCPRGSIKAGTVQFIGKAKVYERYTGSYTQNSDGTYTCDTEEVTEPNVIPDSELADTDTGCISPLEESGAQPLKRCQWFDATEEEALNYTGCPDGMFNSGFTEFPEGSYKILCCTADNSPAPEQGIGAEWGSGNVGETGSAIASTNYCGSYYSGELVINGTTTVSTQSLPISYTSERTGLLVGDDVIPFSKEVSNWVLSETQIGTRIIAGYSPGTCPSFFARPRRDSGLGYSCVTIPRTGVRLQTTVFNSPPHPTVFVTGREENSCTPITPSLNLYYVAGSSDQGDFSYLFTRSGTLCTPVFYVVRVTPVFGCLLTIYYTDNTIQQFPYSSCPSVEDLYTVTVSDSTGVIATVPQITDPSVSYVCRTNGKIC